jgi:hypothetical protein
VVGEISEANLARLRSLLELSGNEDRPAAGFQSARLAEVADSLLTVEDHARSVIANGHPSRGEQLLEEVEYARDLIFEIRQPSVDHRELVDDLRMCLDDIVDRLLSDIAIGAATTPAARFASDEA